MASAVSDGGGSLEATHQGDTIAPVFCTLVFVWKSVSASAWEKKSDVIIYVLAAAYTRGVRAALVNLPSCTHARTRQAIRGGKGTWFCSSF